jgi:hypothetical protein
MDVLSRALSSQTVEVRAALLALIVAFVNSHILALVYVWSHRGLSYSQSFVQTLVMAAVGSAMMMLVIGNNLVWGIGMVGALALVRFRTNLRDPRDMVFVFVSLVIGLAAGTMAFSVAIAGTAVFSLIALYLGRVSFGFRDYFDALLRFTVAGDGAERALETLRAHCSRMALTVVQQVPDTAATEHVYQVRFRRSGSQHELVEDLQAISGLSNLSLMLEETRVEV